MNEPRNIGQTVGKILVMEEDDSLRRVIERMLTKKGFEVVCSKDGAEAIGLYQSSQALQEAKLTFLNTISDQELKHPYYWAGFVQHGKDVTVKFNQGFSIWKWVLGFITLFLILFTYFRIRHKL